MLYIYFFCNLWCLNLYSTEGWDASKISGAYITDTQSSVIFGRFTVGKRNFYLFQGWFTAASQSLTCAVHQDAYPGFPRTRPRTTDFKHCGRVRRERGKKARSKIWIRQTVLTFVLPTCTINQRIKWWRRATLSLFSVVRINMYKIEATHSKWPGKILSVQLTVGLVTTCDVKWGTTDSNKSSIH